MRKILPNEVGFGYGTKVTFLYISLTLGFPFCIIVLYMCVIFFESILS